MQLQVLFSNVDWYVSRKLKRHFQVHQALCLTSSAMQSEVKRGTLWKVRGIRLTFVFIVHCGTLGVAMVTFLFLCYFHAYWRSDIRSSYPKTALSSLWSLWNSLNKPKIARQVSQSAVQCDGGRCKAKVLGADTVSMLPMSECTSPCPHRAPPTGNRAADAGYFGRADPGPGDLNAVREHGAVTGDQLVRDEWGVRRRSPVIPSSSVITVFTLARICER